MPRSWWLAGALVLACGPASAEPVETGWDTYFYDAPRDSAHVLDEVSRKETVDVLGCENGWCRIRFGTAEGYVREYAVHGPRNEIEADKTAKAASCFEAAQSGGAKWQQERFCRSQP